MLTHDDVQRLLAMNKQRAPRDTSSKWFDGNEWHFGKPKQVGSFVGKAGTTRKFVPSENVVAYQA